jgi:hypothetical protein
VQRALVQAQQRGIRRQDFGQAGIVDLNALKLGDGLGRPGAAQQAARQQ